MTHTRIIESQSMMAGSYTSSITGSSNQLTNGGTGDGSDAAAKGSIWNRKGMWNE